VVEPAPVATPEPAVEPEPVVAQPVNTEFISPDGAE
jgi:hypothetical protein